MRNRSLSGIHRNPSHEIYETNENKIQFLATAAFTTAILAILPACLNAATVINIDFSRDTTTPALNPGTNPAPILYSGTGPAADAGTTWNDGKVALTGASQTVAAGTIFNDLTSSTGLATTLSGQITLSIQFSGAGNGVGAISGLQLHLQSKFLQSAAQAVLQQS